MAVQGANDTNQDIDRDAINQELTALTEELDRISETTQFNKQELLDGSFADKKLHVGANSNQSISISINKMDAASLGLKNITYFEGTETKSYNKINDRGVEYEYNASMTAASNLAAFKSAAQAYGAAKFQDDMIYMTSNGSYGVVSGTAQWSTIDEAKVSGASVMASIYGEAASGAWTALLASALVTGTTAGGFGASVTINAPAVDDYDMANATLNAVQDAINRVSTQRSALGALQNRLEHTIANLDNVAENTEAAESRIRDTDMASEMVEYSKNNILAQAGQSMLAQANQSTQGILSLLQ